MNKIKVIIDCDTGVDDALAIIYLLANPNVEVLGITTTYGNIDVNQASINTLLLLQLFNRNDIKVYQGASRPINQDKYDRSPALNKIHGNNGLSDVDLGELNTNISDISACDFIIDMAKKYKDELHLILVGPLTNFSNCLKKDNEALKLIKNITIMGGALTVQGNRNIYAEANIGEDPISGNEVFNSELNLNIIPLDATQKTLFKINDIKHFKDINDVGRKVFDIAHHYYTNEFQNNIEVGAMHDPLAAFASIDPSIITNWFDCNLIVEETGRTISTFDKQNNPIKYHKVALDVNHKRFEKEYIDLVTELIKRQ